MKPFKDYDKIQAATERTKIPAGGYIAVIKNAEVKEFDGVDGKFERLDISVDIAEGEFKDYYANDYRSQQSEDKYWKGVLRQYLPKDDGSDRDNWTKSVFKALIEAIEESNSGYHWDWNEGGLKGKKAGLLLRNEEWEYEGKTGWTAKPFKFVSAQAIKDGKFTLPKDKSLKNKSSVNSSTGDSFEAVDDELDDGDLPF